MYVLISINKRIFNSSDIAHMSKSSHDSVDTESMALGDCQFLTCEKIRIGTNPRIVKVRNWQSKSAVDSLSTVT